MYWAGSENTWRLAFCWFGAFLVVNLPKNHMMTPDGTDGLEGEPTDDGPLWLSRHPQWDGSLSGCFNSFLLNATCGRKQIKTDWVCRITLGWPLGVYSMTDFSEFPVTLQFYCPAAFSLLLLSVPLRFEHLHSALLQHALFPFNVSAVGSWLVLILQHQLLIIAPKKTWFACS